MNQETLDPLDWNSLQATAHTMVDEMIAHLKGIREQPVWQPTTETVRNSFSEPMPLEGTGVAQLYSEFKQNILPYNIGNIHPRFWGWVMGTGTATGMLADMLASGMNPCPSFGDHSDVYVEQQVINWAKQMFNLDSNASGLLTTGGSTANIIALTIGRNHHQKQVRKKGLRQLGAQLTVYASAETHNCLVKTVEILGIGSDFYRKIPVDDDFKIRVDLLQEAIEKDKQDGLLPFCIVGNAGTVNTGSIDDLAALAAIAKQEGMWFHVDGAFGILPKILPQFEEALKPIELADSVAFDFHKWFYVNYDVGCFIIKDSQAHAEAFKTDASYLVAHESGIAAGGHNPHQMGFELSRGFRSLKVWMILKEHGLLKYRRMIEQNLAQAQYLATLIENQPLLELAAPVPLNVVCFRYADDSLSLSELNRLNKAILMQLQVSGVAAPSFTVLRGKYVIRVAITNHRSRFEDFDVLVDTVVSLGKSLAVKTVSS